MFKRLAGLMVLPLALIACSEQGQLTAPDQQPLFAATAFTTVQRYDVSGVLYQPCTDELVDYSGFIQEVFHVTINKNQVILRFHVKAHVTGTGQESGIEYIDNESVNYTEKAPLVNGAAQFTFVFNQVHVAKGNAPNFTQKQLIHVTVNANGEVTSVVENIGTECRG